MPQDEQSKNEKDLDPRLMALQAAMSSLTGMMQILLRMQAAAVEPRPTQAPDQRGVFRTTYLIEVLSQDEPLDTLDLEEIAERTDTGDCVGRVRVLGSERLDPKVVRAALLEMGNDGEFFGPIDEEEPASEARESDRG